MVGASPAHYQQAQYGTQGRGQVSPAVSASNASRSGSVLPLSPRTRSKVKGAQAVLWELLEKVGLQHWYYVMVGCGFDSFADFIGYFDLTRNRNPSAGSKAAADYLYKYDYQRGRAESSGPLLPQDVPRFEYEWNMLEQVFMTNYQDELSRLASAAESSPRASARVASKGPKKSIKKSKKNKKSKKRRHAPSPSTSSSSRSDGGTSTSSSSSVQVGDSARRGSKRDMQFRDDTKDTKQIYSNYSLLNGGYAFCAKITPSPSAVLACVRALVGATATLPKGGTKEMAYLFQSEGLATKETSGGYDSSFTKLEMFHRFSLVINTWTLAFCVSFSKNKNFKDFECNNDCDKTFLLNDSPGDVAQHVGAIPQVISIFKGRVEAALSRASVSQVQACFILDRFLEKIGGMIAERNCSLTVAVLEVQKVLDIFAYSGGGGGGYSDKFPARAGNNRCRHFDVGRCARGKNCRYDHIPGPNGGKRGASQESNRGSVQASQSRSPSAARKTDAGRTPRAKKSVRIA